MSEKKEFKLDNLYPETKLDLGYIEVEERLRFLQGRILTIIDASIDGNRGKAVKDLVTSEFVTLFNILYDRSHRECVMGK